MGVAHPIREMCRIDTGGHHSFEAAIVKKVDMCLLITFL